MPDTDLTSALDRIRKRHEVLSSDPLQVDPGDVPRLLAAIDAVLALHQPFRIYDECDHDHTEEDIAEGRAVETGEFVSCHDEYLYSICTACCRDAQGFQTEECADAHFHDKTHCKTAVAISRALLGEDGAE